MEHFYGEMTGSGAYVTRTGTKGSGLDALAQSHTVGASVRVWHSDEEGDFARVSFYDGRDGTRGKYGDVSFGSQGVIVPTKKFVDHCCPRRLADCIMANEELVTLLRGRIFIDGRADG